MPGNVIIQTYNPDNFSIQYAQKQNYDLFYNAEINLRKQLKYPPFCDIILFGISGNDEKEVKEISKFLYECLKIEFEKNSKKGYIFKPMPAPIDRIKNKYRWRIIIKCRLDEDIINLINNCLDMYYNKKIHNTRVIVDVNPTSMM